MSTVYFVVSRKRSKIDPHIFAKSVLGVFKRSRSAYRYLKKLEMCNLDPESFPVITYYGIEEHRVY